jgi:hypothetical protein
MGNFSWGKLGGSLANAALLEKIKFPTIPHAKRQWGKPERYLIDGSANAHDKFQKT